MLWLFEGAAAAACDVYPPNMKPYSDCDTPSQQAQSSSYPPNMEPTAGSPSSPTGYPPNMDPGT